MKVIKYVSANTRLPSFGEGGQRIYEACILPLIDEYPDLSTVKELSEYVAHTEPELIDGLGVFADEEFERMVAIHPVSSTGGLSTQALSFFPFFGLSHGLYDDQERRVLEKIISSGYLLAPLNEDGTAFEREDQYPGVYMSPYGRELYDIDRQASHDLVRFIFPVTILKFAEWHANAYEVYGDIGQFTFTRSSLAQPSVNRGSTRVQGKAVFTSNTEVVFEVPIPIAYAEAVLVHESRVGVVKLMLMKRGLNGITVTSFNQQPTPTTRYVKGLLLPPIDPQQLPASEYPLIKRGLVLGQVGFPQLCFATSDTTFYDAYQEHIPEFQGKPVEEYSTILGRCGFSNKKSEKILSKGTPYIVGKIRKRMMRLYFG
jgi:hypothetical protein